MTVLHLARRAVPYSVGVRLQRALWSQNLLQQRMFPMQTDTMRRWAERTGQQAHTEDLIVRHLMANTWRGWRMVALSRDGQGQRWVRVNGEGVLARAGRERRGLVVGMPHYADSACIRGLLKEHLNEVYFFAGAGAETRPVERRLIHTNRLREAQQVLLRGGGVIIAADSDIGSGGIEQACFGGGLTFRPGAAELTVRTGAMLAFAFWSLESDGRMDIEIIEMLPNPELEVDARISDLVRRHADLLVGRWPRIVPNLTYDAAKVLLRAHGRDRGAR